MTIAVRTDSAYKTLTDVLRDAKGRPGQIGYASTGNATLSHLTGELLGQAAGTKLLHVPYRGAAPAITDLLGGQVPLIVTSVASINPMVEAGKVRVLGTFTKSRLTGLGNPPTVAEATGLSGMDIPIWVGIMAPAKTPAASIEKLSAEFSAVCKLPETQAYFSNLGAIVSCGGSAAFAGMLAEDSARWVQVIQKGGVKVD
jgi:tripartite-type tricarboxylate transporter receptor subunit TctC